MWGKISDRYGRRPVLLTGLIGNSISSCLFGLSKNLWWAIASRALCGGKLIIQYMHRREKKKLKFYLI
jgi:MFS family permease